MLTRTQFLRSLAGIGATVFGAAALAGCKDDQRSGVDSSIEPTDSGTQPTIDAPPQPTIDASVAVPDAMRDAQVATCDATTAAISANHGHALVVSTADIAAGVEKTYNIQGTATHPHNVVITAAMFAMLKNVMAIMVTSSLVSGHTHTVTVSCA